VSAGRRTIELWYRSRLAARRGHDLLQSLQDDAAGRERFEAIMAVERLLCGAAAGDPPWSHFDSDRIEALILHRVRAAGEVRASSRPRLLRRLAFALPIALAMLLILPWLAQDRDGRPEIPAHLFAPRGGEAPYLDHLFLFCFTAGAQGGSVARIDRPAELQDLGSCPLDGELQFALTKLSDDKRYLYVAGLDEAGRRLWYYPEPGQGGSSALPSRAVKQVFGDSILLQVNHQPGRIRIFALFSAQPVTDAEVEEALEEARRAPALLSLSPLRDDVFQEGFAFEMLE